MRSSAALLTVLLVSAAVVVGVGTAVGRPVADRPHAAGPPSALATAANPASVETVTNGTVQNGTGNATNVSVEDGTTMRIALRENGNAHWHVSTQFRLEDANETAAFERLAQEYRKGRADAGFSRETFVRVAERASEDENRTMRIQHANYSAEIRENGRVGVLTLSFTWTNFTNASDGQLALGDVFVTGSGIWLPELNDDQRLVLEAPEGYYIYRSNVAHNGSRISYEGPRTLDSRDLSVTYRPIDSNQQGPKGIVPGLSGISGIVLVLFLVGTGGFAAYFWTQRRDVDSLASSDVAAEPSPSPPGESAATVGGASAVEEADRDHGRDGDGSDEDEDDVTDVELLSDEERVLHLLERNDGRMKQANIVKETNWSNAKVSQLLSAMDDADKVDKLRIGRENLITLPDEDVTDVD